MSKYPVKVDSVRYNAATQSFEATVTVYGSLGTRNYACAFEAPITMSFTDAAEGLATQGRRRYAGRGGLHSRNSQRPVKQRAGRRSFNPAQWLEGLLGKPDQSAA
jgi:hypothetical protein